MKIFINFIAPILIVFTTFLGCSDNGKSAGKFHKVKSKEIKIIDGNGNEVTVKRPVERIITEKDNAELIQILNKTDKVVGVIDAISDGFCVFEKRKLQFPRISQRPCVGAPMKINYEAALKLKPDLLLVFSPEVTEKQEKLPNVAVVFLGLYYPDMNRPRESKFIKGVMNLGKILDAEKEAEDYINWYINLITKITSKTRGLADNQKPKVFISSYPFSPPSDTKYRTYTNKDTLAQANIIAGGKNIADELSGFYQSAYSIEVNTEWLITQNPDIIILHAVNNRVDLYGYETDDITWVKKGLSDFIKRPELSNIKAVKNKKVYIFYGALRNNSSGGIIAAAYMAKIFHPELFKDLNPEAIHQQYLKMQRLNYDLNKHGIFVYPPIEENGNLMGIPDRYKGQTFIDAD